MSGTVIELLQLRTSGVQRKKPFITETLESRGPAKISRKAAVPMVMAA